MGPTLTLLTATLLVAQTPTTTEPGKTCGCQKNNGAHAVQYVQPIPVETARTGRTFLRGSSATSEERPTFLSRIQGIFGRKKESDQEVYTAEPPIENRTGMFRPMKRMPKSEGDITPVSVPSPAISSPAITNTPQPLPPATVKVTPATYQPAFPTSTTSVTPAVKVIPPSRPNRISKSFEGKVGHETDYSWITGQIRIENGHHVLHFATPETVDRYNGNLILLSDRDLRNFSDGDFVSARGQVVQQNGLTLYRVSGIDLLQRE